MVDSFSFGMGVLTPENFDKKWSDIRLLGSAVRSQCLNKHGNQRKDLIKLIEKNKLRVENMTLYILGVIAYELTK